MKILWQALRAATVETLSVAVIVFLLFGVPTWSFQSAVVPSDRHAVWTWLKYLQGGLQRNLTAVPGSREGSRDYVEKRPDDGRATCRDTAAGSMNSPPWSSLPLALQAHVGDLQTPVSLAGSSSGSRPSTLDSFVAGAASVRLAL